jgi:hypothetical protein
MVRDERVQYEIEEDVLKEAVQYAIEWEWDLPAEFARARALFARSSSDRLVTVVAPTIAPGVVLAVPEDLFFIYVTGEPRSLRMLVLAVVFAVFAVFKVQSGELADPMNLTGRVLDMAMDLLGSAAFLKLVADAIDLAREHRDHDE